MNKTKELIICIISILVLILAITTNVFATDIANYLDTLPSNDQNNTTNNVTNNTQNIITPTIDNNVLNNTANNVANNIVNNTNNNTNNNTAAIPYTGVNNSAIVIIAICGISAIYAYKKIRDYNV